MNDVEITVDTEFADPIIVSVSQGETASIGLKRFKRIGEFKYEWTHEYLSREDLTELIKALTLGVSLMEEPQC